mmetsp:Transcript_16485/g.34431  ORF Transcript_16485/g.34431 Transcript_16485/m.34431 type:complete len:122 (-) Transcript_16485:138-503(-)
MIGLSLAIVANSTGLASAPCRMLLVHYAFNLAWAPVFFGAHKMMAGFVLQLGLIASLVPILKAFYPISPTAAALLGPYTLWLLFASALNWRIWQMNHGGIRPPVDNSDGKGKLRALLLASK